MGQSPALPERMKQSITDAGKDYQAGKIDSAVTSLEKTVADLENAVGAVNDNRALNALRTIHGYLEKAYQKLELDGVELRPLPTWDSLIEKKKKSMSKAAPATAATPTSTATPAAGGFESDVAPWLVSKCGRCHINDARGGFSMASMASLMKGSKGASVIESRDADHSRLVEVIESGDMPRGGAKVTPAELAKLKDWINKGTPFDPAKINVNLIELARSSGAAQAVAPKLAPIAKPTGKETVSFAKDVAPILIASCAGCHYDADQLQGGLNMDTFARFWRGGESGSSIEVKKGEASLIVKKLRGTDGRRMPAGRAALSNEQIAIVSKWIDEGATFDGYADDAPLGNVATRAWAESASPEEISARRREQAIEKWKVAFSRVEPVIATDENFVVVGDVGQSGIEQTLRDAQEALAKLQKALKLKATPSFTKGDVTIFAIKERYAYGEFGKMNESRTLPTEWQGHWRRSTIDAYVAILYAQESSLNESNLLQHLASLWVSNYSSPSWFSDGFGRAMIADVYGRKDANVKGWDQKLVAMMPRITSVKELVENRMNEEDAALLGYYLCRKMAESNNGKAFDGLLTALGRTKNFDQAFNQSLGPIEPTLNTVFGIRTSAKGRDKK